MTTEEKNFLAGLAIGAGAAAVLAYAKSRPSAVQAHALRAIPIQGQPNLLTRANIPSKLLLSPGTSGVVFGRRPDGCDGYVGKPASEDGHILVIGPPGTGKTSSISDPSALSWKGHTVSLVIKGDLEGRVRELESAGRCVLVFAPAAGSENTVRYDPFATLGHHPETAADHMRAIAMTLCPMPPEIRDPVWIQAAQTFLTGALLFFYRLGFGFHEAITSIATRSVFDVIEDVEESGCKEAQGILAKLSDLDARLLSSVGFELACLSQLASPKILTAFTPDVSVTMIDWNVFNHSHTPCDVILAIPESKLPLWKPMVTLMLDQLFHTLKNRLERTYSDNDLPPVLVVLDEVANLTPIPSILSALSTLRSRGVTIMLMSQSIAAVSVLYGETATKAILENCGYKVILGAGEPDSQDYFSRLVGSTALLKTSSARSVSVGLSPPLNGTLGGSESQSYSLDHRPLILPQAFSSLTDAVCITPFGPFRVDKRPVYSTK